MTLSIRFWESVKMTDNREALAREFALAFGQDVDMPIYPEYGTVFNLRQQLVAEEAQEVQEAADDVLARLRAGDDPSEEEVAHLLKEMADLQYVLSGMAMALSLPLKEAMQEVHDSNMSKLNAEGKPVYNSSGKVLKGHMYRPADMTTILRRHCEYDYP